jgi:hypothetical protein
MSFLATTGGIAGEGGKGPRIGEPVIAIGFPLKGLLNSDAIITTGTISALAGAGHAVHGAMDVPAKKLAETLEDDSHLVPLGYLELVVKEIGAQRAVPWTVRAVKLTISPMETGSGSYSNGPIDLMVTVP